MDYSECKESTDCAKDNLVCREGYCVEESDDADTLQEIDLLGEGCTRVYGTSVEDALSEKTVLLGSLLPYSGALAAYGPQMAQGIELAVDEINQAGGIQNKKVAVLFCDDGTDVEVAERAARHLVKLGRIPAVIGPGSGAVALETFKTEFYPAGIVLMSPSETSPMISSVQDDDLLWRTVPSDAVQGEAIGEFLLNEADFEKIAVINRDDVYGIGLRDAVKERICDSFPCEKSALFYSRSYSEDMTTKEQSEIIGELADFAPDVTVLISFFEEGSIFLQSAVDVGVDRFVLADGLRKEELTKMNLPDEVFCHLVGTEPASPSGKNFQSFSLRFNAKYDEVGSYSANAYDALYLISYAIAAAAVENPKGTDVATGLRRLSSGEIVNAGPGQWNGAVQTLSKSSSASINYEGASGPLDFNEFGEASSDIEAWALDMDERVPVSLGTLYTYDGEYLDIVEEIPGQGTVCDPPLPEALKSSMGKPSEVGASE